MAKRPFDSEETAAILAFVRDIGIAVERGAVPDGFLPGIAVRHGRLIVDPDRLRFPGDLLHDAGHLAVSDPSARPHLAAVADDPGEEMAAIAWSFAAAQAIGIDPRLVFHNDGYRGGGAELAHDFAAGRGFGVPLLEWYGMVAPGAFPAMTRWLR
jgi:hypothetical protein